MPISGERLLRPDGMISLGFYGDVYVKGMTLDQVKVAIIKQLRRYLTDESLGLETRDGEHRTCHRLKQIPGEPANLSSPKKPER